MLLAFAKRSVAIVDGCSNIESTRLYLALPFLGLLGYNYSNPYEVFPEHRVTDVTGKAAKADFAVLRDGKPFIAMETRSARDGGHADQTNLRTYFRAVPTVKLAIQTNGILYSFFVDVGQSHDMDLEAFLTIDLETIDTFGVADDVLESLRLLTREFIDSDNLAKAVDVQFIKKRLRKFFIEESSSPSKEFCRFALERVGMTNIRPDLIERYYAPMVKSAFSEHYMTSGAQRPAPEPVVAVSPTSAPLPVMPPPLPTQAPAAVATRKPDFHEPVIRETATREALPLDVVLQSPITFETAVWDTPKDPAPRDVGQALGAGPEAAILNYVRRRLAFLIDDEKLFSAIDNVSAKDYTGRIVVYYERERKGRMFDFIPGTGDKLDKYLFPTPLGEIRTRTIADIDQALKTVFLANVREQPVTIGVVPAVFPTLRRVDDSY